uniref:Uncharacterized protein n=1 Tax=Prorocentrum micans TaxID=2945 RepID=A0A7S2X3U1_PROMC
MSRRRHRLSALTRNRPRPGKHRSQRRHRLPGSLLCAPGCSQTHCRGFWGTRRPEVLQLPASMHAQACGAAAARTAPWPAWTSPKSPLEPKWLRTPPLRNGMTVAEA